MTQLRDILISLKSLPCESMYCFTFPCDPIDSKLRNILKAWVCVESSERIFTRSFISPFPNFTCFQSFVTLLPRSDNALYLSSIADKTCRTSLQCLARLFNSDLRFSSVPFSSVRLMIEFGFETSILTLRSTICRLSTSRTNSSLHHRLCEHSAPCSLRAGLGERNLQSRIRKTFRSSKRG